MNVEAYLRRIEHHGPCEPTPETLRSLHRAHMCAVPFENLDIPLGRTIELLLPPLFEKIVDRRRGGFCYELNALFGWLLREIGFDLEMLSACVYTDGVPGPEFDHMLLLVDGEERVIADVGFGDSFVEPLPLGPGEHTQRGMSYRLRTRGGDRVLERRGGDADWEPQCIFSLTPRRLDEFGAMCRHQQTSPDSVFTRKSVCSRATPSGRITLSNGRLIVTDGVRREERQIAGVDEYRSLLQAHFGFDLDDGADVTRLVEPMEE